MQISMARSFVAFSVLLVMASPTSSAQDWMMPVTTPRSVVLWPDGAPGTRLVVIGVGLDQAAIERSFRAFCRLGHTPAAPILEPLSGR